MSKVKKVGIWIRVSTDMQVKDESPEHHERRARSYADAKCWDVVTVYNLAGVSGKSVLEHPEARRMFDDIKHGRVTGIIFSKLARLARNTRELLDISEYFEEHKADLVSLQESIDTSTPAGRFFYTLVAAVSQWEREEISDRVKASVRVRAEMGKAIGGPPPFGYGRKDKQLVLDENEAPIRREMFELFLTHKRYKTVARCLNEKGYRTRRGVKFHDSTVKFMLTDPTAKGKHRANYTEMTERGVALKDESEWVYQDCPAIVSEKLWNEVNAIIRERAKGRKLRKKAVQLFGGQVVCHCGQKMYVPSSYKDPKYVCKACRNKILGSDLERVFVSQMESFFLSPEAVARQLAEGDRVLAEKEALLSALVAQAAELQAQSDAVFKLYMGGQISPEGFGERHRPVEERLASVKGEIPRLKAEVDFLRVEALSQAEVISEAGDLYRDWDQMPFERKRAIVEAIVEEIVVHVGEIEINLAYLPSVPTPNPPFSSSVANGQRTPTNSAISIKFRRSTADYRSRSPSVSSTRPASGSATA